MIYLPEVYIEELLNLCFHTATVLREIAFTKYFFSSKQFLSCFLLDSYALCLVIYPSLHHFKIFLFLLLVRIATMFNSRSSTFLERFVLWLICFIYSSKNAWVELTCFLFFENNQVKQFILASMFFCTFLINQCDICLNVLSGSYQLLRLQTSCW